ncbi:MAG: DUF4270 family protein, partial [Chitinophagaceae bacterium]
VGGYSDPIFGKIETQSFLQLKPDEYTAETVPFESTFDSLTLVLKPNGNFYGDSTKPINIQVHQLTEKIVAPDQGINLYNTTNFSVGSKLGERTVVVRPTKTPADSIVIRLSDDLGKLLLKKMMTPFDQDLKSDEAFVDFFHGIRLSTNTNNSEMIVGCSNEVVMRLHFKRIDIFDANKTFEFRLNNQFRQFNRIIADRTGTPLANLGNAKEITSTLTNNQAFTQSATGTMAKLRFPSLKNILLIPKFAKLLSARLIVRPVQGTYNRIYSLPPSLRLSTTNLLNQLGQDIVQLQPNGSFATQTGNLQVDYLFGINTFYTYDLSDYLKQQLNSVTENAEGLLLVPPSPAFENQMHRVVVGDSFNRENKIQLELFYIAVK